jgi:ABC-type branched-subunit amino acid transport system substrate-binding protein
MRPFPSRLASLITLGALVTIACGGGAAGTAATPGVSGDTITVGALTPLSDPVAVIGRPMLRAMQVYFARVNAAGGIGGRYQVKVLEEDITYANPSTSVQKYQKIKDQVVLLGLVIGTDHINGLLPLLREDRIVATPGTLDAEWVRTPNLLSVWVPYQLEMINGIGHFRSQPGNAGKTVCSMVLATGYGEAAEEGLTSAAASEGFTPGPMVRFRQDDQDFVAPITQLRNGNCEAVILASLPAVTGKVLGAAAQLGWSPRWILTFPSWHGVLAGSSLADYLAKTTWVIGEGSAWGDTTDTAMKEVMEAVARYAPDQQPDSYFLAGWSAANSVGALLEQAVTSGDLTRTGILAALEAMGPVSNGGWGEYRYGPIATREPPRANTIFRINPAAPFGLEVEARNVSVPAAQSYQFPAGQ